MCRVKQQQSSVGVFLGQDHGVNCSGHVMGTVMGAKSDAKSDDASGRNAVLGVATDLGKLLPQGTHPRRSNAYITAAGMQCLVLQQIWESCYRKVHIPDKM